MANPPEPVCRLCQTVRMTASVRPSLRADVRIGAWLLVAFGLAIGLFSHGSLLLVLGGLVLAMVALPLTDPGLVRVWLCPRCGHFYPRMRPGESPQLQYRWRPLVTLATLAGLLLVGLGFWVLLALYGWDLRWFGPAGTAMEKLRIALGFAVLIAILCIFIESMEHYPQESMIWRGLSLTALLLGLGTTANAATSIGWLLAGPAQEWLRLGVLIIGEAVILVMAMRRSRLFVRQH